MPPDGTLVWLLRILRLLYALIVLDTGLARHHLLAVLVKPPATGRPMQSYPDDNKLLPRIGMTLGVTLFSLVVTVLGWPGSGAREPDDTGLSVRRRKKDMFAAPQAVFVSIRRAEELKRAK